MMATYTLEKTGPQVDSLLRSEASDVAATKAALRNITPADNDRVRVLNGYEYVWVDGDQSLEKTRTTGTNTTASSGKLIASAATFQTALVAAGDVVKNTTDGTSTTVVSVDSQTQLTLNHDIFTATSKSYAIGYINKGLYLSSSISTYGVGETNEGRWKAQLLPDATLSLALFEPAGDYDYDAATGTDDTAAFLSALDALPERGKLVIPMPADATKGYYYTDHLPVKREQTIEGEGMPKLYTNGKSIFYGTSIYNVVNQGFEPAGEMRNFSVRSTEARSANGRVDSGSKAIVYGGGDNGNPAMSCTATASSRTLTTSGDFTQGDTVAPVVIGAHIVGPGIPDDTFVVSIESTTSLTMSKDAALSSTDTFTFYAKVVQHSRLDHLMARGFSFGLYSSSCFGVSINDCRFAVNDTGVMFEFDDDAWVRGTKGAGPAINIHGGMFGTNYKAGLHIKGTSLDGVSINAFGTDIEQNGIEQTTINGDDNVLFGDADILIEDCANIISLFGFSSEGGGKPNPRVLIRGSAVNIYGPRIGGCTTTETITAGSTVTVGAGKTLTVSATTNAIRAGSELDFSGGGRLVTTAKADAGATSLTGDVTLATINSTETATYGIKAVIEIQEHASRENNVMLHGVRNIGANNRYGIYGHSGGSQSCNLTIIEHIYSGNGSGYNNQYDRLIKMGTGQKIEFYPLTSTLDAVFQVGPIVNINQDLNGNLPILRLAGQTLARQKLSSTALSVFSGGGILGSLRGFSSGEKVDTNEPKFLVNSDGLYFGVGQRSSGTTDGTTASKLVDSTADFVADGVAIGDTVWNETDTTSTTVTAIDDGQTLSLNDDIFVSGEVYTVGPAPTKVVGSQEAAIASLTDSTGGTDDGTLTAISGTAADANLNNNFSELETKLEGILAVLRSHGLIAT